MARTKNFGASAVRFNQGISLSGSVGANAGHSLVVTGSAVISGLSYPMSDGTANYVLKTDGNGSLSWTSNSGGGSGSPGGSNTQLQYNNNSSFGGVSGVTTDGTNVTFGDTALLVGSDIIHSGDADTFVRFETNNISLSAGGAVMTYDGTDLTVPGVSSIYVDKIRRASDSSTTTKILLNDEALKLYAGHSSDNICTIDSTGLTIDNGSLETATIDYTDGDLSMTIADGGKVTFAAGFGVGSDAAGDILYHNGTSYIRLAKGTADQVLTMNDAATAPGWEAASGGGGSSESTVSYTLGYATLNTAAGGSVSDALTIPAGKTLKIITIDITTGFTDSYGSGTYATIYFKSGSTSLRPRGTYTSYGSVSEGSSFWGASDAYGSTSCRLTIGGGGSEDFALYWSNQSSTLTAGSAIIKAWYV